VIKKRYAKTPVKCSIKPMKTPRMQNKTHEKPSKKPRQTQTKPMAMPRKKPEIILCDDN
jgi:hypothetical protein